MVLGLESLTDMRRLPMADELIFRRSSCRCRARRLQGCGPPQQIVDHHPGRLPQLRQSGINVAALVVSPQGCDRDVDRRADRGELKLDHRFAELLDAARATGRAIAHEAGGLSVPFWIN